jgi:hypothetical protein
MSRGSEALACATFCSQWHAYECVKLVALWTSAATFLRFSMGGGASHCGRDSASLRVVAWLQGCKDTTCHINEGKALYAAAKRKAKPYWAAEAGHNDVELSSQYVTSVKMFLVDVWGPHYA